tara:strand:- start:8733 stop:10187 length:1455 start_codon:yes stop_codon:yes gene_type:complete
MTLKDRTILGAIWSFVDRIGNSFIQIILMLILARILDPKDFGTIGVLVVFSSISRILVEAGFSVALIRKQNCEQILYSTVFYLNIIVSVVMYIALYILSPFIADFFNLQELTLISKYYFIIIPIYSLSVIQYVILQKELNFKLYASISLIALFISGIIAIILAYLQFGVWSLIWQAIIQKVIVSFLLWYRCKWRPMLSFRFSSLKDIWNFSLNSFLTSMLIAFFNNLYAIIIGKLYKVTELGFYSQAKQITTIPNITLISVIQRAIFPSLSKIQSNTVVLKKTYIRVVRMLLFIIAPIFVGIFIVAEDLIVVVLGEKWLGALKLVKILSLVAVFQPYINISHSLLKITDQTGKLLKIELIRRIIITITLIVTSFYSIEVILYGHLIITIAFAMIFLLISGKKIELSIRELLYNSFGYVIVAIVSGFTSYIIISIFDISAVFRLVFYFLLTPIIYYLCLKKLRMGAYDEILLIVNPFIKKIKKSE